MVRLAFHPLGTRVPSLAHAIEKTTSCASTRAGSSRHRGLDVAGYRSFPRTRSARLRHARAVRAYSLLFSSHDRLPMPHLRRNHRLGSCLARQSRASSCGQPGRRPLLCCNNRRRAVAVADRNPRALANCSASFPITPCTCYRLAVDRPARLATPFGFEFLTSSARTNNH